jgi:hypothetical protein
MRATRRTQACGASPAWSRVCLASGADKEGLRPSVNGLPHLARVVESGGTEFAMHQGLAMAASEGAHSSAAVMAGTKSSRRFRGGAGRNEARLKVGIFRLVPTPRIGGRANTLI